MFALFPEAEAKLFLKVVDAQMDFEGAGGKATELTLLQNGRDIKARPIEK